MLLPLFNLKKSIISILVTNVTKHLKIKTILLEDSFHEF